VSRFSPEEIVDGLRRRDNRVLRYIYKSYFPAIAKLVLSNSGNEDDAKDIFQEALIVVFRNIREKPDFKLGSNPQTYLYSIARLLWLQQLRNSRNSEKNLKENHPFIDFEDPKPFNDQDLKYSLYQKVYRQLPVDCQHIIKMTNEGKSQKEIAEALGFKSENYIKKRKHYCKEFLIKKIKESPDYQEAKEEL
jgi:RNA polymerase sigma factor (sigma-70 family)